MKKLLLFIAFASAIALADESSSHQSALAPRIINPPLKYPSLGIGVGLSSGALCGLVDAITNDSLWIFTWISTLSLRELIIRDYLNNDPAFKDNSADRNRIANITGHLSAWIAYGIVKGVLR